VATRVVEWFVMMENNVEENRSQWLARVMRKHPEVLEFKERLRPLGKSPSYGRVFNSGKTEVKEVLSHQMLTQLILQFLDEEGLKETKRALEEESKIPSNNSENFPEETLSTLLSVGIKDINNIFEQKQEFPEEDAEVAVYDYLPMGSFEDGIESNDTELKEEESSVLFDDSTEEVLSGSLNSLVAWLTSAKNPDLNFRSVFFMTYRTFTTPEILLHKIIRRYTVVKKRAQNTAEDVIKVKEVHQRIFTVTKYWMEHHKSDWNEKLITTLHNFIDNALQIDHPKLAKLLRNTIVKMESGSSQGTTLSYTNTPDPKVPKNIFSPSLCWSDVDEEEIARQFTLIEYDLYASIQPLELLLMSKGECEESGYVRTPNLSAILQRFNDIVCWVSFQILDIAKLKLRSRTLAHFVKIAFHLRKMNNYNTLMAILTGISNCSIHRLKSTKRELSTQEQKTLEDLEHLMHYENSYGNYRKELTLNKPPIIPFMGLHLRDLEFLEEASEDKVDGLINFRKRKCMWKIVNDVLQYQSIPFNFHHVHQIATLLLTFDLSAHSEEDIFLKSLSVEPKGHTVI